MGTRIRHACALTGISFIVLAGFYTEPLAGFQPPDSLKGGKFPDGATTEQKVRSRLRLEVSPPQDGYLVAELFFGGRRLRMIVDTGAPTSWVFRSRLQHIGVANKQAGGSLIGDLRVGEADSFSCSLGILESDDANKHLRELRHPEMDGLLGLDVLRKVDAVLLVNESAMVHRPKSKQKQK